MVRRDQINDRLKFAAENSRKNVFAALSTSQEGLADEQVEQLRELHGDNNVTHGKKESLFKRLCNAFINPFTAILFVLAIVSACTEIIWAAPGEKDATTVIIITVMVLVSGILRFVQETRSSNAAAKLSAMIHTTAAVTRKHHGTQEIPMDEIVVGDIVTLSAGDMIPADLRIVTAKDLFISQSALTASETENHRCYYRSIQPGFHGQQCDQRQRNRRCYCNRQRHHAGRYGKTSVRKTCKNFF